MAKKPDGSTKLTELHELTEARLRTLNTRLNFLLSLSPSPATIYTCKPVPPYAATFVSANLTEMLGYTVEEFLATPGFWADHIHPDDCDRVFAELPRLFTQGKHVHEYRLQHQDGSWRWMSDALSVVPGPDSKAKELIGYFIDITAHKQAEEALRESEARLRAIVDLAVDGIITIDDHGTIATFNSAAERLFGYAAAEVLGQNVTLLMPEPDRSNHDGYMAAYQRTGVPKIIGIGREVVGCRKDGSVFPMELGVSEMRLGDQRRFTGIVRDITERNRAKAALARSLERLELATSAAQIGVWDWNLLENTLVWDDQMFALYGVTKRDVVGAYETWLAAVHPDDRARCDEMIQQALRNKQPYDFEFRVQWPNGTVRVLKVDGRVVRDSHGIPVRMTGTNYDITERQRMEDTLRQREHALRAAVEERERISHDLHDGILQSLFAVGLALETTKSRLSPGSRKTSGASLDQAIAQLNRVMREVRNFIVGLDSDLLQGKDLKTALREMLASLTAHQATRVRLTVEERATQAVSVAQALHLFHIVQEAVSNCVQHSRAQKATVSLTRLKQGIRLRIRDNGRGFNPKAVQGTGHGLGNMAARAQKLGGRLAIISKCHEGTRIVLDLPNEVADVRR